MIEEDTIKLLRECDAGVKMGMASIEEVIEYTSDPGLQQDLAQAKQEHERLHQQIQMLLSRYHDEGKEVNVMAKSMSWIKTNVMLVMDESDATIADLITDGCNMGVKSLSRYLNQYPAADSSSKEIACALVKVEEDLAKKIRCYL